MIACQNIQSLWNDLVIIKWVIYYNMGRSLNPRAWVPWKGQWLHLLQVKLNIFPRCPRCDFKIWLNKGTQDFFSNGLVWYIIIFFIKKYWYLSWRINKKSIHSKRLLHYLKQRYDIPRSLASFRDVRVHMIEHLISLSINKWHLKHWATVEWYDRVFENILAYKKIRKWQR